MLQSLEPQKGRILLSEPFLDDDYFNRSVVLLAEKTEQGSMGFILNKPIGYHIHELITDFPEFEAKVYWGGPVNNNALFFIHALPDLIGSHFEIGGGIHYGGDFEKLKQLIPAALIDPDKIRFFAGYSGWDAGQLDAEMRDDAWMVFERPAELLSTSPQLLWGDLLRSTHSEKAIWANFPENPNLN
jgi:putative transcriptional regulator